MPLPSEQMLDVGEAVVSEGMQRGAPPREIARDTFVTMRDTKNPRGRPRARPELEARIMQELREGRSMHAIAKEYKLGGSLRGRLWDEFKEKG